MLNPNDVALLSRLFDEAQGRTDAELQAWLAARPENERALLPRLLGMLDRQRASASDSQAWQLPSLSANPEPSSARPGERVGPYRLLRELGRGGMGEVWLAERADGAFERQLALKLPRLAWGSSLNERLRREATINAQLEHPHIARLYDAGTDEQGRPFIATAYIEGQPIDAWCRAHAADLRQRLRLVVQVARAVAYAHARLIVHRDLKPANILVDAQGQAHLLDFGIAKLLDAADDVQAQDTTRVHTPRYAAPEQREGLPITTATDVYALGLVLYELLTGELPPPTGRAALASHRNAETAGHRQLRGELGAMLDKALAPAPDARYTSADALADDLERYLNGESVLARPDGALTRLRKLVWRHRLASAALCAAVVTAAGGGTALLLKGRQAQQDAERARLVTQFVSEMLWLNAGARTPTQDWGTPDVTPQQYVEAPAQLIESRFAGQPELRAQLLGAVADVYVQSFAGDLALKYAERQLEALRAVNARPAARAAALLNAAQAHQQVGQPEESIRLAREALALLEPDSSQRFFARTLFGHFLSELGQREAMKVVLESLERESAARLASPSLEGAHFLDLRAEGLLNAGRFDDALRVRHQAADMAYAVQGPGSPLAIALRLGMADALIARDRIGEADLHLDDTHRALHLGGDVVRSRLFLLVVRCLEREAYHQYGAYADSDANLLSFVDRQKHSGLQAPDKVRAEVNLALGIARVENGELREGAPEVRRSAKTLLSGTLAPRERLRVASYAGRAAMRYGQHDQAGLHWQEVLRLRQALGEDASAFAALDWQHAAQNLVMRGDLAAAHALLAQAPARFEPLTGGALDPSYYDRILPLMRLRLLLAQGRAQEALEGLNGLGDAPRPQRPAPVDTDAALAALPGEVRCAAGQPEQGLPVLLGWIERQAEWSSWLDPGVARVRAVAGLCALRLGDRHRAAQLRDASRRVFDAQPVVSSDWYRQPLLELEARLKAPSTQRQAQLSMAPSSSRALSQSRRTVRSVMSSASAISVSLYPPK